MPKLATSDLFVTYRSAFESDGSTKNMLKSASYLSLTKPARAKALNSAFVKFCIAIEEEKLVAFASAREQFEPVLIVRSPATTKAVKRFLGYSWSKAKGKEGIKVARDAAGHHMTPLYDESNRSNPTKINHYIAQNFDGKLPDVPTSLAEFAEFSRLEYLLDFSGAGFDHSISLDPVDPTAKPVSVLPLERLSALAPDLHRGASPRPIDDFLTEADDGVPWIKIGDAAPGAKTIESTAEKVTRAGAEKSRRVSPGDLIVSNSMSAGRPYIVGVEGCVHDGWLVLGKLSGKVLPEYLFYMLSDDFVQRQFRVRSRGPVVKNLNIDRAKSVLVPVANIPSQRKLIASCNAIEKKINQKLTALADAMAALLAKSLPPATAPKVRLDQVATNIVRAVAPSSGNSSQYIGLENVEAGTGRLRVLEDADAAQSNKLAFDADDVLYGKLRPRLNKVAIVDAPGLCSTDFLVLRFGSPEAASYYATYLRTAEFNVRAVSTVTNTMPRTSWEKLAGLEVPKLSSGELEAWFESAHAWRRTIEKLEDEVSELIRERAEAVRRTI